MTSLVTLAKALYSASAKEQETMPCFFDFHETKESPRNTRTLVVDFLVSKQLPDRHPHKLVAELRMRWKRELPIQECASNIEVSGAKLGDGGTLVLTYID